MRTKIYGASDDLIEIDGAISDEVNSGTNKKIICSDGTTGRIHYDNNGEWKIIIKEKGTKFVKVVESLGDDFDHTEEDAKGYSSYSDVLVLDEGIDWVQIGSKTFYP